MTAVFLFNRVKRLRFQNLGKPRTAGLCGRAAGACDCGPLSCAKIERVNKGRKPPKRDLAGRETPIPKGSVFHRRSRIHRVFSHIAHKRRNVRFKVLWWVHTPPQPLTAHTAAHRAKHGRFGWGVVSLPSERSARSPTSPGRVSERHTIIIGEFPTLIYSSIFTQKQSQNRKMSAISTSSLICLILISIEVWRR